MHHTHTQLTTHDYTHKMLRVYILQHYGAFQQHIPSYAFIVER